MLTLSNQQSKNTIIKSSLSKKLNLKSSYNLKLSNDYSLTLIRNKSNNLMINVTKKDGNSIFNTNIDLNKFEPDFFEKLLKAFHKIYVENLKKNDLSSTPEHNNKEVLDSQVQKIKERILPPSPHTNYQNILRPVITNDISSSNIDIPSHLQFIAEDVQNAHKIVDKIAELGEQRKHALKFVDAAEYCGQIQNDIPHGYGVYINSSRYVYQGKFKDGVFYTGYVFSSNRKNLVAAYSQGKKLASF